MNLPLNVTAYGYDSDVARSIIIKNLKYYKSYKQISEESGLSINTIRRIVNNETISKKTNQKLLSWAKNQNENSYKSEQLELI